MELSDLFDDDWPPKQDTSAPVLPTTTASALSPPPKVETSIGADFRADFLDWLENGLVDTPRAPGLHCSSLWKTCPRVPLLEKKYAKYIQIEKNSAGQQLTFDVGHALHHHVQNKWMGPFGRLWGRWKCLVCQMVTHEGTMPGTCPKCDVDWRDKEDGILNIVYDEMFVVDDKLKYCGHCDGILLTRAGNKVVFEFKTISKSQYGGLRAPKYEHIIQVHAYMAALGLTEAVVLYLDKGSQADWRKLSDGTWSCKNPHIKVFQVSFDHTIWANLSKRIMKYHEADELAQKLPVVEIEHINQFKRVCSHKKCNLASECHLRDLCFAI